MDREDGLYLLSVSLVACGCWLVHSAGAGLIASGLMLGGWPFVSRILGSRNEGSGK